MLSLSPAELSAYRIAIERNLWARRPANTSARAWHELQCLVNHNRWLRIVTDTIPKPETTKDAP